MLVTLAPSGDSRKYHTLEVALLCNVTEQSTLGLNTYVAVPFPGIAPSEFAAVEA